MYTLASSAFIFSSFPGGLLLDRCGPVLATVISTLLVSSGFIQVAHGSDMMLMLGFALVGSGLSLGYSIALKSAFLFHPSSRTNIIALVNGLVRLSDTFVSLRKPSLLPAQSSLMQAHFDAGLSRLVLSSPCLVRSQFDASALMPLAVSTISSALHVRPRLRLAIIFDSLSGINACVCALWICGWIGVRSRLFALRTGA